MWEIHRTGVQIAIDNFGTGHASLSYLKRFPIDTLHIARSYVRDIGSDSAGSAVVQSVIALRHALNMKVLAKGVETEEQLDLLRTHGCDLIQGYLFSKPLPPEEIAESLKAGRSLPVAGTATKED